MALSKRIQAPGSLCYLKYDPVFEQEKPFFIRFPVDDYPEAKQTNLAFDFYAVAIEDIRDQQDQFKFDVHGFELIHFESKLKHEDFNDFRENNNIYIKEIEEYFKNNMGFDFVEVCHLLCKIRRRNPQFPGAQFQEKHIQPIRAVHVDSSRAERVKQALASPTRAGIDPNKGRTQMFGCKADDIVDVDQVYPDAIGEGCNIYFNKNHKWFFVSGQMPHEALSLKQLDSRPDAADYCAHAAFPWKDVDTVKEMRESIEVRCVAWSPE
ncbi:hypothetical protein O1611_g3948 [Lasiodiplodia mahajangana]|uniref:Uncharacterized protein n=1 Tax=Lasiodiplodia mahajangana TaxID=1108764 RepID=A0ACC2JR72_9PEZI|nr:hypothetical protein O1611_g3948 [Lasiodiplodia mahajangana]